MDNNWNFKTLGTGPPGTINRPPVSTPLSRQGSLFSWTLDQIQNNLGKDCGSMNMEELLMSICSAEGTQGGVIPTNGVNEGLQKQGSITLPRILSQKTVDEVWKYITEEELTNNDGRSTNIPQIQKQPTFGDITLEEFLTRAGAVGNNNSGGYIHDPSSISGIPNTSLSVEFQQKPLVSNVLDSINIVPGNRILGSYLHPNVNGSTSAYKPRQEQQKQHNPFQPQQPIMSNPHGYGYGTHVAFTSGQVNGHGIRDSYMETGDQSHQDNKVTLVQSVAPVPGGAISSVDACPQITPFPVLDGIPKINAGGTSIVSPFLDTTTGRNSVRDRNRNKGIAAEKKLVEKTHWRKIKNRESAARSRARKQIQTMELEAEAEKLRKENQELLKKQAETMLELQTKLGKGITKKRLRRTKSNIQ
ncbi:ABSCISIC ACID-INSENSITIVE 5-like protein 8 [Raphanus sativus]|uniref:ABSCISIC ACID-INSENSITIVE 5-like protein 8 n=1 Tax=Raphanus sativus TaxID=3726 RepID=A0A6J0NDQ1_RAPSA|nr:ABSCISIC ACID-INSENSITIVE 5-like protein 8 [Raphanus sativus]